MKLKQIMLSMLLLSLLLNGCGKSETTAVTVLDAQEAKTKMDQEDVIILDVRTSEEYQEGHIDHAINIPLDQIEKAKDEISKDAVVLVYCRSGNRSAQAAKKLVDMEYTNVFDFGGIMDWPYEIVK